MASSIIYAYQQYCDGGGANKKNYAACDIALSIGCFLEAHNGAITAVATLAIATFTLTLWIATRDLWNAGKDQLKLVRDEFISTHRPKLIVRQFELDQLVPDQPIKIQFSIVNIGDTEAIWKYFASEVALWNRRNWEPPGVDRIVKPISQPPIKNGQRVSVTSQSRFNITAAQIQAVEHGGLIICAVGELTYVDALGTQRRTGFRRNYDCNTAMFNASPNNDQEYQD